MALSFLRAGGIFPSVTLRYLTYVTLHTLGTTHLTVRNVPLQSLLYGWFHLSAITTNHLRVHAHVSMGVYV